jgi:hypothetical protein
VTQMNDTKELLQRARSQFPPPEGVMDSLIRRRDRKRRNQRIAAGVVGIAVFVAAVWIVTSGLSFDRTETPAVPGPAETGPAETEPPYGEPDVVRRGECHFAQPEPEVRLELWDLGDRIRVRFGLLSMAEGGWLVVLRHTHIPAISSPEVVFQGTRVPRHNIPGHFRIIRYVTDLVGVDEFQAKAVHKQTGQVCKVLARI